jgi:hypothetical protein
MYIYMYVERRGGRIGEGLFGENLKKWHQLIDLPSLFLPPGKFWEISSKI